MIKSISTIINSGKHEVVFDENQKHKIVIDISVVNLDGLNSFDIEIVFSEPILQFRNHDYKWVNCNEDRIANEFCPKIIKLQNGQFVQANINSGIWEVNKNNSNILLWRFNPEFAEPITNYLGSSNRKKIEQSKKIFYFPEIPYLLLPKNYAIEFSRSKYPFTAVACFTDHCDFDTAKNLVLQREFFKENQIKITKGFFLNHFSKRDNNASFQNEEKELLEWKQDGHELCYHSLSQSIKSDTDSFSDFEQFQPPVDNVNVWIDHGYQPYNFSLFKKNNLKEEDFKDILLKKNINTLWNYVDSGTATTGVINQFNTQHFTLLSFLKGNKDLGFIKKMQLMIKNIIFHYYSDENIILKYKNTAGNFKKVFFQKEINLLFPLMKNSLNLAISILSVLLFWNKAKKKPYKLAKYSPIVFKHVIADQEFYIFQTLEMLDFKKSLAADNIDTLINEKGVFIAHTYFSVPMHYHKGRLFSEEALIDEKVFENFKLLGEKIQNKEIWNPTLTELIEYWQKLEQMVFDVDLEGNLFEKSRAGLEMRNAI